MPTLAPFAPRYLDGYARANREKPSSIAAKDSILRIHLIPRLGDKRLDALEQEDIQRLKAELADNLRIKGPHTLRHTFCSHLAMRGAPARAIQELAGHRHLTTTQRYMHLSPAALQGAIALLEASGDDAGPPVSTKFLETDWRRGPAPLESR